MRTVRVRAQSPDRSVVAAMNAETGLAVRFELGALNRHDRDSLAVQVRRAVSGVLEAYRRAADEVLRRDFGADSLAEARRTGAGQRLQPFLDALERVEVKAVGPREVAKVGMTEGRFRVAFRDEALDLGESGLAAEIEAALSAMFDRRAEAAARLYEELVVGEVAEAA